jgi:hypothetical protein
VWLPADEERWQAYWVDDGSDEQLVFYCAECAQGEFGDSASDVRSCRLPRAVPRHDRGRRNNGSRRVRAAMGMALGHRACALGSSTAATWTWFRASERR